MTIIGIIGSSGVIGSYLVPKLLADHHTLHLINPTIPKKANQPAIDLQKSIHKIY